jgi:hypothetical protein
MQEKKKRKRKGITIKIRRSQLESDSVGDKVKEHLKKNKDDAYTIMGLMIEIFGIDREKLNGPFTTWPNGAPSLYTRIRHVLEKLKEEGVVDSKKQGKAVFYFSKTEN